MSKDKVILEPLTIESLFMKMFHKLKVSRGFFDEWHRWNKPRRKNYTDILTKHRYLYTYYC